jgi:hypothetical protein
MSKGLLLSAVIAMISLPVMASREKDPKVGLKKAIRYTIAFNVFYLLCLRFIIHM